MAAEKNAKYRSEIQMVSVYAQARLIPIAAGGTMIIDAHN